MKVTQDLNPLPFQVPLQISPYLLFHPGPVRFTTSSNRGATAFPLWSPLYLRVALRTLQQVDCEPPPGCLSSYHYGINLTKREARHNGLTFSISYGMSFAWSDTPESTHRWSGLHLLTEDKLLGYGDNWPKDPDLYWLEVLLHRLGLGQGKTDFVYNPEGAPVPRGPATE